MKYDKELNPWISANAVNVVPECIVFAHIHGETGLAALSNKIANTKIDPHKLSIDNLGTDYGPIFNKAYDAYQEAKKEATAVMHGRELSPEFKAKLDKLKDVDPFMVSIGLGPDDIGLNAFFTAYAYSTALTNVALDHYEQSIRYNKDDSFEVAKREAQFVLSRYLKNLNVFGERIMKNSMDLFMVCASRPSFKASNDIYYGTPDNVRKGVDQLSIVTCPSAKIDIYDAAATLDRSLPENKHLTRLIYDSRAQQATPGF